MTYTKISAFALASLALVFCTGLAMGQVTVQIKDTHILTLPESLAEQGESVNGYQGPQYRHVTSEDDPPPPPPPAGGGYQYALNLQGGDEAPILIFELDDEGENDDGDEDEDYDKDGDQEGFNNDDGDDPPAPPPGGGYQRLVTVHGVIVERDANRGLYRVWLPGSTDPVLDFFTIITTDRINGRLLLEEFGDVEIRHIGAVDERRYQAVIEATNQSRRVAEAQPDKATLTGNYPNPFNPETMISFRLAASQHVRLSVYNALGQRVQVLVDGMMASGQHEARFAAHGLPSGTYFTRLETEAGVQTRSIILTK